MRIDTYGSTGYQTNPAFDSLLAKVIGHAASEDVSDAVDRTRRALARAPRRGRRDQRRLPEAVLAHPDVRAGVATTDFVDRNVAELVRTGERRVESGHAAPMRPRAGAVVDSSDPLAVLVHGKSSTVPRDTTLSAVDADSAVRRSDAGHDRQREHRRR